MFPLLHHSQDLIHLFHQCFRESHQTELIANAREPLYLPASVEHPWHRIFFTKDYFRSALHECAHWFIAGEARRLQVDYGYWYEPDGRNAQQQKEFQQVEVKPQALEYILCQACRHPFSVSLDNLDGDGGESIAFEQAVMGQVAEYYKTGLPVRAQKFREALGKFYAGKEQSSFPFHQPLLPEEE